MLPLGHPSPGPGGPGPRQLQESWSFSGHGITTALSSGVWSVWHNPPGPKAAAQKSVSERSAACSEIAPKALPSQAPHVPGLRSDLCSRTCPHRSLSPCPAPLACSPAESKNSGCPQAVILRIIILVFSSRTDFPPLP